MKPGFVRCPLCGNPVAVNPRNKLLAPHWARRGRPGGGFRTLSQRCEGTYKKPEDLEGLK